MKREIKRLSKEHMPEYINIYLNAYPAGKDISKEDYEKYFGLNLESLESFDDVNFYGLFEDDKLKACMKLIDFDMNLFGKMGEATGLMALAVHPLYKKKGLARLMVEFFEKYACEKNSALAMLLPFNMEFYLKMGYGSGDRMDEYHIPTEALPELKEPGRLKWLNNGDIDDVIACYREYGVRKNYGMIDKFQEEVRSMYGDTDIRRIAYIDETGKMKGYIAFNFVNTSTCNYTLNLADIKEIVYADGKVLSELLGSIRLQSDLVQSCIIRTGNPDFHHILKNPMNIDGNYADFGYLATSRSFIGTMYKIVEPGKFVEATSYRKFIPVNLCIAFTLSGGFPGQYEDDRGSFTISFKEDPSGRYSSYSFGKDMSKADINVTMPVGIFSSMLMGGLEFADIYRLGLVQIDDISYVNLVDSLFHTDQKPFSNTDY